MKIKEIEKLIEVRMGTKDLSNIDTSGFTFGVEIEISVDLDEIKKQEFEDFYKEDAINSFEANHSIDEYDSEEEYEEAKEEYVDSARHDHISNYDEDDFRDGPGELELWEQPYYDEIHDYYLEKEMNSAVSEFYNSRNYDIQDLENNFFGSYSGIALEPKYGFSNEDETSVYKNEQQTETHDLTSDVYSLNELLKIMEYFEDTEELQTRVMEIAREQAAEQIDMEELNQNFTDELKYLRKEFAIQLKSGWLIVRDSSVTTGGELISPVYNKLEDCIESIKRVFDIIKRENEPRIMYTTNNTGIHINIGRPEWKGNKQPFDIFKFLLLTNESYVTKLFGRESSNYNSHMIKKLSRHQDLEKVFNSKNFRYIIQNARTKLWSMTDRNFLDLNKLHEGKGYIEFRGHGGYDYFNKIDDVEKVIRRYLKAITIASDENLFQRDYYKKVFQLITAHETLEKKRQNVLGIPSADANIFDRYKLEFSNKTYNLIDKIDDFLLNIEHFNLEYSVNHSVRTSRNLLRMFLHSIPMNLDKPDKIARNQVYMVLSLMLYTDILFEVNNQESEEENDVEDSDLLQDDTVNYANEIKKLLVLYSKMNPKLSILNSNNQMSIYLNPFLDEMKNINDAWNSIESIENSFKQLTGITIHIRKN